MKSIIAVFAHFSLITVSLLSLLAFACTSMPPQPDGVLNPPPVLTQDGSGQEPPATSSPRLDLPALPALTAGEKCFEPGAYGAIDTINPLDQKYLNLLRQHKVGTIMRYYDWVKESIRGKTPTVAELKLIFANGFNFAGVFQHYNSSESTFRDSSRPALDAARIAELAKMWGQPKGSAVFIGYDGDFPFALIKPYATAMASRIRASGFRVGMYGSGGNCKELAAAGLIDRSMDADKKPLCFIAASSWGWRGTKAILGTGEFVLAQYVNKKCGGKGLDYSVVKAKDFGQWWIQ